MGDALVHFEAARAALAQAYTLDEVKGIRDKAEAARVYARQAGLSKEMQNQCAEIRLRAERRAGELLAGMAMHGGDRKSESRCRSVTLNALGITRKDSSRWQRIATIPDEDFERYVARARATEITQSGALKLAKRAAAQAPSAPSAPIDGSEIVTDLAELAGRGFACVYADPPWAYGNQGTRASTDDHYTTMSVEEIAGLPVAAVVADDAHLHLWTTNAFLFESRAVMEAWGFTYKSCFVWVKPQIGMGNYWRVSHEFLLLGVRGRPAFLRRDARSWGEFERSRHSSKPEAVRLLVESVSSGPRLEMFARRTAPGWVAWGNQVEPGLYDGVSV